MVLDFETYRDKVMGCWAGKNIGGVLGAPFECTRGVTEVDFYTQDLSMGPPPNDDLDLQIVWLAAVERYGRNVNASILGDYWLSYIIPNWVEYGTGKANLRAGLVPPMSGFVDNPYKDSCGCFIRSEIWACLCPGNPELAARYAYEDASVDHADEGLYGEIFFAALQSAAFVESDMRRLIEIGLSYVPEDSFLTRAVRKAVECHENGVPFREARVLVHNTAPGTFGIQGCTIKDIPVKDNEGMEIGVSGFDAPENCAFAILGWLYSDGDFGKAICIANACGEDTDCTCATLGATLGIIMGAKALPEKWTKPLDDKIATMCIDKTSRGIWVPDTVTQLTDRILRVTPSFLGLEHCDILAKGGYTIRCESGDALFCRSSDDYLPNMNGNGKDKTLPVRELCQLSSMVSRWDFPAFTIYVDLIDSPFIAAGETKKFKVRVINHHSMRQQHWARITLYAPDGVAVLGHKQFVLPLNYNWGACAEATFEIDAEGYNGGRIELLVDVSLEGRHSTGTAKVVLYNK